MIRSPSGGTGPPSASSRGQIGASTLLVLIAVLIVAATTAGVLFNVTDSLRSEASVTGAAVGAEVESDLQVAAVTGRVNQSREPSALETLRIVVARDGADGGVDLSAATVGVETQGSVDTLEYGAEGTDQGSTFGIEALVDEDGSAPVLDASGDRFAVVVATSPLEVGETVRARITLGSGSTRTVEVTVPRRIHEETTVGLA